MPNVDLSEFATLDDLKQLAKDIEAEIARRRTKARDEFYEHAKQVAAELDMPVSALFGKPRKNKGRDKARREKTAHASDAQQQRATRSKDARPDQTQEKTDAVTRGG
jgi:hypothetical protein